MAHIDSIGASVYTRIDYKVGSFEGTPGPADREPSTLIDFFQTDTDTAVGTLASTGSSYTYSSTSDSTLVIEFTTAQTVDADANYEFDATATGTASYTFKGSDVESGSSGTTTWTIENPTTTRTSSQTNITAGTLNSVALADNGTVEVVEGIREFPSLGTPSNVVNVPVFGRSTSDQVQGQADAPSLEFTFNYIPTKHAKLDTLRKNDTSAIFRVRISSSDAGGAKIVSNPQSVEFNDLYFEGKVASFEIVPALTDATQANIALTIQGEFEGPFSAEEADYGDYGLPS